MLENNIAVSSTVLDLQQTISMQTFFSRPKKNFSTTFQAYFQFYALKSFQRMLNHQPLKEEKKYLTLIVRVFIINKNSSFFLVVSIQL